MEHTPGPWKVVRWNQKGTTYGEPIKRVKIVAPDCTIICDNEPYYPVELLEENADLIAAAPELLEELERVVESARNHRIPPTGRARAVIAKVKGA